MDAETALFVVSAALAAFWSTVIGILHVRGWLPKAYISRLRDIQAQTASQVGQAVSVALRAVSVEAQANLEDVTDPLPAKLDELPARIGVELEAALNRVAATQKAEYLAEAEAAVKSGIMSATRGVRTIKDMDRQADQMIGKAILGAGQGLLLALRQIAPGFADQIEELLETNPEGAMQLWEIVQSRPSFQKYIAPRLAVILNPKPGPTDTGNPFLGEMGR